MLNEILTNKTQSEKSLEALKRLHHFKNWKS